MLIIGAGSGGVGGISTDDPPPPPPPHEEMNPRKIRIEIFPKYARMLALTRFYKINVN
jgi:hypothetical protein